MKNEDETNLKNDETNKSNASSGENTRLRHTERKAKEEGVRKGAWISSITGVVVLLVAVLLFNSRFHREQKSQYALMENQKNTFTTQLTARDSTINEWMLTFDQVEKDLNLIKEKEKMITMNSSNSEFSKDKRQQVLKDLSNLNALLDLNKKKIESLTAQLKNSGGTIKALQSKVADLEASMTLRENEITELKSTLTLKDNEIGQLNKNVADQQVVLVQKDEKITNQTNEINKGFLAYGTYKDLKEKGLVEKEGGFLGLGKKESLMPNFSDSSFTRIDITQLKVIPVNSKSVKLITDHPKSSYELIRTPDDKITGIEITNPEEFWKISKYAIVEIK